MDSKMWMWKKFKLVYRKPLLKPKSLLKEGKNGGVLNLKMECGIEIFFLILKNRFVSKVITFDKTLEFKNSIILLLWQASICGFTTKST
jgi:hypothetical protein